MVRGVHYGQIVEETMDVVTGLAAVRGITAGLESVNKLLAVITETAHHEQLVQLKEALLTAKEETLTLREDMIVLRSKLADVEASAKRELEVEFDGTFYWIGKEKKFPASGPYCTRCFDMEKRTVRLQNDWSDHFSCPGCKTSFAGPNAKIELSKPQQVERYDSINSGEL